MQQLVLVLSLALATASAYQINGDNVNCRDGPGTNSKVVRQYNKGHDVTLTCQTNGDSIHGDSLWDKTADGCYVADWFVETHTGNMVVGACGGGNTYPINGDNVNCRTGANTGTSVIRQYNKGDQVTLTCQTNGESVHGDTLWAKTTDGCYVADWFVQTNTGNMVVGECGGGGGGNTFPINGDNVNCRTGANTGSSVSRQYNKGDQVTLTCQTNGESIHGDTLWDKTTDGCYVADWFVQTNTGNMVVGQCGGDGGEPPSGQLPTLNSVQSRNANLIIGVVKQRGLGAQGCRAAITTALTESKIKRLANNKVPSSLNYPNDGIGADYDSVGIFQQRQKFYPDVKCDMTAACSAGLFFDKMVNIGGWQTMDLATLCQKVQVSQYPTRYQQFTGQATTICKSVGL